MEGVFFRCNFPGYVLLIQGGADAEEDPEFLS
jgi:hypothetical protein